VCSSRGNFLSMLLVLLASAVLAISTCIPQALAVYKYIDTEKDTEIWLVGLAEGEASYLTLEGNIESVTESGLYEPGFSVDGRVAFYLRGKIKGEYIIKAIYDTAKENPENKLFSALDPDKYYPIYGDSSSLERVGESQDKLYIRIERHKSFISYGSYETGFNATKFISYNRTLQGIKTYYVAEQGHYNIAAFGAITPQVTYRDEIRGDGTSGYYRLSHKDIIEGSDKVVIETRNKDEPDEVIETESLERDKDYFLYYSSGLIMFKEPVPSRDEDGNPIWIVIDYEYMPEEDALEHYILGFRGELEPTDNLKIGATYISDRDSPEANQVYGLDLAASLGADGKSELSAEYAHSVNGADDVGKMDSSAFSAEVTTSLIPNLKLKGYYGEIGRDFHHPQKTYDLGTQKYGVSAEAQLIKGLGITAERAYLINRIEESSTISNTVGLAYEAGKFIIKPEYTQEQYSHSVDPAKDKLTTKTGLTLEAKLTDKFTATAGYETELIEQATEKTQVNTTRLGAKHQLDAKTEIFAEYNITAEADKQTTATTVGVNRKLGETTDAYAKYTIEGGVGEERSQASIGMNTPLLLTDELSANLALERQTASDEEGQKDTTAYSGALEYLPLDKDLKSTLKYETRLAPDETKKMVTFATVGKLSQSLSAIAKYEYGDTQNNATGGLTFLKSKAIFGLAYRPVDNDRLNVLTKYQLEQLKDLTETPSTDTNTATASIEAIYELTPKLQLFGKYALRKKEETSTPPPITSIMDLVIAGTTYKLTKRLDLSGEYRVMHLRQTEETRTGYAVEIGYYLTQQLKPILGYAWTAYDDLRFSENDYWVKGLYLRLMYKF